MGMFSLWGKYRSAAERWCAFIAEKFLAVLFIPLHGLTSLTARFLGTTGLNRRGVECVSHIYVGSVIFAVHVTFSLLDKGA